MMNVMMILSQLREHTRRGPPSQPSVRLLNLGAALGFALCASSCSNFRHCSRGQRHDLLRVSLTARKFAQTRAREIRRCCRSIICFPLTLTTRSKNDQLEEENCLDSQISAQ